MEIFNPFDDLTVGELYERLSGFFNRFMRLSWNTVVPTNIPSNAPAIILLGCFHKHIEGTDDDNTRIYGVEISDRTEHGGIWWVESTNPKKSFWWLGIGDYYIKVSPKGYFVPRKA